MPDEFIQVLPNETAQRHHRNTERNHSAMTKRRRLQESIDTCQHGGIKPCSVNGMAEACRSKEPSSCLYAAEPNDKVDIADIASPNNESSIASPRASFATDEIRGAVEQERANNKRKLNALDDRERSIDPARGSGGQRHQDREMSERIGSSCVSNHAPTILLVGEKLLSPRRQASAPKYASFLGISPKEETKDGGQICVHLSSRAKVERKNRSRCQRYEYSIEYARR